MLLTQDLESPSGLGRYFPLAKYLVREGYRVSILALHPNYADLEEKQFVRDGVQVRYVAQMHVRKADNKTYYFSPLSLINVSVNATKGLYRAARQKSADIILVGKPHPMNGLAGWLSSRHNKSALIVDCDDYEAESNHTKSNWQKKVLRFFENSLPKKADLVTTNTYFMKDYMITHGVPENKIAYIPNGVDAERFSPPSEEKLYSLKQSHGLQGKRIVGYFGSLNLANHPVDLLVRSFKLLSEKTENISLLIVGGGKDLEKLRLQSEQLGIADKVVFTGRVPSDQMNLYYRLADVSVDPVNDTLADRGRCPLKLFESWYMGVPVVSSDVGDRKILMGNQMADLLAEAGDEVSLSEVLANYFSSNQTIEELRVIVRNRSAEFNWAAIARNTKLLFSNRFNEEKTGITQKD